MACEMLIILSISPLIQAQIWRPWPCLLSPKQGCTGALSVLWMREEHAIEDILSQGTLRDVQSAAHLIGAAMDTQKIPAFEHA